jgi:hypothetical protein
MIRFLGILLLAAAVTCPGQAPTLKPAPVRSTLQQILETMDHYPEAETVGHELKKRASPPLKAQAPDHNAKAAERPPTKAAAQVPITATPAPWPHEPDTAALVAGIQKNATWLAGRLSDEKTPAAYARSVELNLTYLRAALSFGAANRLETLKYVFDDLEQKHQDCMQAGMGRLVKLEVRTIQGTNEVKGWQVFYRWLPGRAVGEIRPQPFPSLSSPTAVELPPGAYSVRAVKSVDGREVLSGELRVPVGGRKSVTFELPVP